MGKKEDEFGLWKQYKEEGDREAKKELIHSLTPLIRSQANKYKNSGLPYKALELEGRKLASKAIDDYDPNQGTQLNTYVTTHLRKLSRFTNQYQNVGSIPEPRALMIGKYNTVFANLEEEKGREPSVTELADAMHVPPVEIERLQSEQRSDLHMEFPSDDEDSGGFHTYVAPEAEDPILRQALDFAYHDSSNLDKKIIEYWFGYGGTQKLNAKEIKEKLNLSETELRNRRKRIAGKIRELT